MLVVVDIFGYLDVVVVLGIPRGNRGSRPPIRGSEAQFVRWASYSAHFNSLAQHFRIKNLTDHLLLFLFCEPTI